MAGVKISALPPVATALATDIFAGVQAGVTSQISLAQVQTLFGFTGGILPIAKGGTGASTAPNALVNLGLGTPTGTVNVVLSTSPTLITPTLGVASATSLNLGGSIVLDVYSAGTFTPTITGSVANATSITYDAQYGRWIQIGKIVHYTIFISITAVTLGGASGDIQFTGLPLISQNSGIGETFSSSCYASSYTYSGNTLIGNVPAGFNLVKLISSVSAGAFTRQPITGLSSTSKFSVTGFYFIP